MEMVNSSRAQRYFKNGGVTPTWYLYPPLLRLLEMIGSFCVVLLSANIITSFLLLRLWGEPGDFWQYQWNKVVTLFNDDIFYMQVYGLIIWSFIVYWTVGIMYTFIDLTGRPRFLYEYKIQSGETEHFSKVKFLKVILLVLFNLLITSTLTSQLGYKLMTLTGQKLSKATLPSFYWVIFQLIIFNIFVEVGVYYAHRLFHHPLLYKHFHKVHHEYQAPFSIMAAYAHPLEHVISNLLPLIIGPAIMGAHMATVYLWFGFIVVRTLNDHSGYHLPLFPSAEFHDYHHLKFNQCFGVLGIFDYWHGTDDKFRRTKHFQRHKFFMSLIPPNILIPDKENSNGRAEME